mgnify:CR=1 FL=1
MTTQFTTSGLSLLRRLELISNQYPDNLAITYLPEGDPVNTINRSYGQLQENAYRIASSIRAHASIEDRVLLLLPPGPDYFAAVWGCLLAGVVVVPVQVPQQPALFDFANNIIADCNPALLLTEEALQPDLDGAIRFDQSNCKWMTLETALNPLKHYKIHEPESQQIALLQYTSGSTGTPKGVIATFNNLDACIDLMLEVAAIDKNSTVVSWLPLFHNMGFLSFGLLPLSVGAHLVLIPTDKFMLNPARWFIAMSHYRATHSGAPNIGYETCLNFLHDALLDQLDLSNWDVAAIGSEPLKSNLIDQFTERFSRTGFKPETFLTTYGFSEATVFCSGADNNRVVPRIDVDKTSFEAGSIQLPQGNHAKTLVSVGTARPNVAVVNPESRQLCGDRELGEIWICGPTVAAGYWNRPEVTAETFNQFATDGSGPYVRSGDIGMIADDNLYVVGRRKELIIVGSKKLHPLDIEQVVNRSHPGLIPYATIASSWETQKGEALAVFQEIKPDTDSSSYQSIIDTIRDNVHERFQVNVERIVLLAVGSLPRTHNGKLQRIKCCELVDNGALVQSPALDWSVDSSSDFNVDQTHETLSIPQTETEFRLITIWQEMLNHNNVSIHADFVTLGGQSIIATRMVARLQDEFSKDLTVRDLFKHSSISKLARYIDNECKTLNDNSEWIHQPLPFDEKGRLPLTSAQKRMWLLQELDPASSNYHMSVRYQITAGLCVDTLTKALNTLVERHSILRTIYTKTEEGEPRQEIVKGAHLSLDNHALTEIVGEHQAHSLEALIQADQSKPFALDRDLMLRAALYQVKDDCYVLTLTLHHIAADGWSVEILARELSELYSAHRTGNAPSLEPVKWQYADWTLKHELATKINQEHTLGYWLQQLKDIPEKHSLPLDRSHTGQFSAARYTQQLSKNRLDQLIQTGQKQGATLYMQLQLAMAILMARLTGDIEGTESATKTLSIGAAYANRDHSDCTSIVGFMVNSLVIRHTLEPEISIAQLMERCRTTILEAYEHADIPFELLVEKLNPPRNDYNPLFQVMINLQSKDSWNLELAKATVHPSQTYNQEAKFDLALDCTSSNDGLQLQWEFNQQILNPDTVERWAGYFDKILTNLIECTDKPWDHIDILGEPEKEHLLYRLNDTQRSIPELCVHELFELHVQQTPNAIALKYGNHELTYSELNYQAERIQAVLRQFNLQPEDRVVVLMERSLWSVIAMLATLKAGAAYVPIDPAYPRDRIDYILQDAAPSLILTHLSHMDHQQSLLCHIDSLTIPSRDIESLYVDYKQDPDVTVGAAAPHNMAYMMYTSGSTGTPKGVVIEHRQITNLVFNNQQAPLDSDECMAHCGNPAFDAATWEIWGALCRGASLAIISPNTVLNPDLFTQELLKHGVTSMMITVSLFNQYRLSLAPVLRRLNYCLVGGEAVDPVAMLETLRNNSPRTFINDYGPTEATVFATCHRITKEDHGKASIPIGTPVDNTQIYILDSRQQPVPTGVIGEMYIGGAQVARGYWNRPELNETRFLRNPYASDCAPSNRLYRTGDLARWTAADEVEFIGRNDTQVKIRGYRVELGEIETALARQNGIKGAVVRSITDDNAETKLVAYIVASPDVGVLDNDLISASRLQLQAGLPDHMIPTYWVCLSALPLTPHGKLDESALPPPDEFSLQRAVVDPPQGDLENLVAVLWSELLGIKIISRHDNFFGLGGHSLLAVKLVSGLRRHGYIIDIRGVFQSQDLAELAIRLQLSGNCSPTTIESIDLPQGLSQLTPTDVPHLRLSQQELDTLVTQCDGQIQNIQAIYPLSPLQEGILFHHLIAQQDDPYLLRSMFDFSDRVALDSFIIALEFVVDRHDALRTSAHWNNLSHPVQVVRRNLELNPVFIEAESDKPESIVRNQRRLLDYFDREVEYFDITKPPMLSLAIVQTEQGYLLGIQAHHIIADHQALEQIFNEISIILDGKQNDLHKPLPYAHFVLQNRSEPPTKHEQYFKALLATYDSPAFVLSETSDSIPRQSIRITEATVEPQRFTQLSRAARMANVSISCIAHLAWGMVVSAFSGKTDVVFGSVLSGRAMGTPAPDNVIGLFINTLPVRIINDPHQKHELIDTVKALHHQLSELAGYEQVPLALVKRCSNIPAEVPLFNTLLNYRHRQTEAANNVVKQLQSRGISPVSLEQSSHYPIALSISETTTGLSLCLQTTRELESVGILEYYQTALQQISDKLLTNSPCLLNSISVLPNAVSNHLVNNLAITESTKLENLPAQLRFENVVDRLPNGIAVKSGSKSVTYSELNIKANQIANLLIGEGIHPEDRVAVYFDRSIEMIASLIGILKAGAGYLPLDIRLPESRLRFMLTDAAPKYVLAESHNLNALRNLIGSSNTRILSTDATVECDKENPAVSHRTIGSDLAYMIYTSGSTGTPKGVEVEHQQLSNLIDSMNVQFSYGARDKWSLFHSISFDFAVWEIWGALTSGAQLVVVPDKVAKNSEEFLQLIRDENITVLNQTPGAFKALLDAQDGSSVDLRPGSLRQVILSGEALDTSVLSRWHRVNPAHKAQLINMYGITEITVVGTFHNVTENNIDIPPIGRPLPNTEIYILDDHQSLSPPGAIGEMYVGGSQVTRGYWKRADLTHERFLEIPIWNGHETRLKRLYKSGDLGRWRDDGVLEYCGRNDDQIKIRGYRIELGEIETCIRLCEGIADVKVHLWETETTRNLVAYLVPYAGINPSTEAIQSSLLEKLPSYMHPAYYVTLDALPLTANGKIDTTALPTPIADYTQSEYQPPIGVVEEKLALIWIRLLNIEKPCRTKSFMEQGGDSLLAVQINNAIKKTFEIDLPLRTVFELASIEKLGEMLQFLLNNADSQDSTYEFEEGELV